MGLTLVSEIIVHLYMCFDARRCGKGFDVPKFSTRGDAFFSLPSCAIRALCDARFHADNSSNGMSASYVDLLQILCTGLFGSAKTSTNPTKDPNIRRMKAMGDFIS